VLTGNDLILVQGAGNIGKIARNLAEIIHHLPINAHWFKHTGARF
jgi:D-arabinose 5-phosphate isomerase GutQ